MQLSLTLATWWMLAALLAGATVQPIAATTNFTAASVHANNPLIWDAMFKQARMEAMNQSLSFTFWVTNSSSAEASILHTESSCDCTVAKMPSHPWVLKPGESGALGVKMNLLGRHGRVTKQVLVGTSHGEQLLTVQADIPLTPAPFNVSARQRDMMAAQQDRQAVFRGSCAACHALPAAGRSGEALFTKACAICHISTHRAAMVPDLATLPHANDAAYWRQWITHGKEDSLMPAFAKSAGGILDPEQIESLVEYLGKTYPPRPAATLGLTNVVSTTPVPAK